MRCPPRTLGGGEQFPAGGNFHAMKVSASAGVDWGFQPASL